MLDIQNKNYFSRYPAQESFVKRVISNAFTKTEDMTKIVNDTGIALSFVYSNFILTALIAGFLFSLCLSFYLDMGQLGGYILTWSIIGIALALVIFATNQRILRQHKTDIKKLNLYMYLMSFIIGLVFALAVAVMLQHQGMPLKILHHTHVGITTFILILFMIVLGAFGNKPAYILVMLVTCLVPSTYQILLNTQIINQEPYFYLYGLIFIFAYIITVFIEYKLRKNACLQYVDNWRILKESDAQKELMKLDKIALTEEADARLIAEQKLQKINAQLEQTINERTEDISIINANLTSSKKSLEMAHEAAGLASWEWDVANKSLTSSNLDTLLEYDKDEFSVLLNNLFTLVHPDDETDLKNTLKLFLSKKLDKIKFNFRLKNKRGIWMWFEVMGVTTERNAKQQTPSQVVGIIRDISLEKSVTDSLNLSNKVFEQSSESIFVLDADYNYISINPSYEKLMGYSLAELEGKPLFFWYEKNIKENIIIQKIFERLESTGEFNGQISEKNKQGSRIYMQLSINKVVDEEQHETVNYIGVFSDLTKETQNKQKLSYLENYDKLTDLPNRNFFKQQLHSVITETDDKFSVIRINIDRFRLLNESFGSQNADLLLKKIAERMTELNYSFWTFARFSGDDFAILFRHSSLYHLKKLLEDILSAFIEPFYIANKEVNIRLSMGVSLYPNHGNQVDTLITKSEQALISAKKNGGDNFFIYSHAANSTQKDTLSIENELRHAIHKGELTLFYQPKICISTNKLIGFEALIRWNHTKKGLLMPNEFMGIAVETGLIHEIGTEIMMIACQQIATWSDMGIMRDRSIAINIEVQQLKRENFLTVVDNILSSTSINPKNLELEITESSIMDMPEKIAPLLKSIKERQIKIAMDDFGTGYSSLSYLGQYPIDVIKIDRSFIKDFDHDTHNKAIVRAIIAMSKSLGITVVAEGVEDKKQLEFLKGEGCDIAQGYYFGKPMPVMHATKILSQQ